MSAVQVTTESRPRVLLVDDEVGILETTAALLEDDFDVSTAANADEAMTLLEKGDFDVLCSDYSMPGMNGAELLRTAMQQRRHLSGVLVSGYREFLDSTSRSGRDRYMLLVKPYAPDALIELLRTATKYASIKRRLELQRAS